MLKMDINISPKQLENKNFISKLKNEIDDFVTGYRPLSYLKLFPCNKVNWHKIIAI